MNEINVIYQFNEKYVPYAGVSMTSLLVNNMDADSINIYVMGEDLSDNSIEMLYKMAKDYGRRVVFPKTGSMLKRFKELGMIPYRGAYSVYLRLFFAQLPEFDSLVKREDSRVIYLDADTIVNGSLLPLVNYDLGGKSIGMVLESIRDDYKVMIGMRPDSDFYNSGMILFDVGKWVSNNFSERLVRHIKNVRSSYIGDQDYLNIICDGEVCRLPMMYNYQPLHGRYSAKEYFGTYRLKYLNYGDSGDSEYYSAEEIERTREGAVIYHCYRWLGEFPWNKGNLHPFNELFDKYLQQSMWGGYVKENADAGLVLRTEKLLYRILPKRWFVKVFKLAHEKMLKKAEADARQKRSNDRA